MTLLMNGWALWLWPMLPMVWPGGLQWFKPSTHWHGWHWTIYLPGVRHFSFILLLLWYVTLFWQLQQTWNIHSCRADLPSLKWITHYHPSLHELLLFLVHGGIFLQQFPILLLYSETRARGLKVRIRVSTSLRHLQVKWPTDLSFWMGQVFTDLGRASVEAGTCHRYPPYLSLNLVLKVLNRVRDI